jgi:hypothetical protein
MRVAQPRWKSGVPPSPLVLAWELRKKIHSIVTRCLQEERTIAFLPRGYITLNTSQIGGIETLAKRNPTMLTKSCSTTFALGLAVSWPTIFILAVVTCVMWADVGFAQSGAAATPAKPGLDSSLSRPEPSAELKPEPNPRPDWVPKGAVWTGKGWSAPPAPWDLYDILFDTSIHNDEAAVEREKRGQDGSRYRNSLKEALGLTEAQAQDLRQAALRSREETDAIKQRINAVIKAYQATVPKDAPIGPDRWKVVPPPPKELDELEQQRQAAIMRVAEDLKQSLGPEASARLEKHIKAMGDTASASPPLPGAGKKRQEVPDKETQRIIEEMRQKEQEKQQQRQEVRQ